MISRWARARIYRCSHPQCPNNATITSSTPRAHNCCTNHEADEVWDERHFPGCPIRYGTGYTCIDPVTLCAEAYDS